MIRHIYPAGWLTRPQHPGRLVVKKELETANDYCSYVLPDLPDLENILKLQKSLAQKMCDLQPYIDSELKLNTELIGKMSPQPGDTGSFWALIYEYTLQYAAMHDRVMGLLEESRSAIQGILQGNEMKAMIILEGINAIQQKEESREVSRTIEEHVGEIFSCVNSSRASIDKALKTRMEHDCGLSFANYSQKLESAQKHVQQSHEVFEAFVNRKMEFFLTPAIRDLLKQGENEPIISLLLKCRNLPEIRAYLVDACLKDSSLVETVNLYLKRIVIKPVRIADFKPRLKTVERDQIQNLVTEFQNYLEDQFKGENASDSRLMLRLE